MMMPYSFVRSASRIAVRSTIAFIPNISICLTVLVLILILVLIPLARKGILDSCIQLLCCIVSHLFLSVVNSCRFANNCQVSAGTDRNVVADNLVAQIFRIFLFQSETVVFSVLVPLFQTDYEVDILCLADTRSTEQRLDVHNTNTAQLDKVLCDIRCGSDQCFLTDLADLYNVVRSPDGVLS